MKKYVLSLMVIVMFNQNSSAQCQDTFRTQSEVNAFGGCNTLGKLVIVSSSGYDEIVDLTPLLAITYVAGDVSLSLGNLENIKGLNNITTITGSLNITGATTLSDLSGVATSESNAFSSLYSIGGELNISSNPSLLNISGFAKLNNCSGLSIRGNNKLQNIQGINNLVLASSYLNISESNSLQVITGFNSLYSIGALNIIGLNSLKDISGFQNVDNIIGNSTIGENPLLETISGFGNMGSFGNLSITGNLSLTTLSGFNGNFITDTKATILNIANNANLKTITGFKNAQITSVNINNNDLLTEISGFTNLISAEDINMNSDMNLNTISGFNALISAKYIGIRDNKSLTSLSGLFPNLDHQSIEILALTGNENLSVCAIPWLCNYINDGFANDMYSKIGGNATDCNTATEINDNCKLLSLNTDKIEEKLLSYPNPVSEVINIEGKNNSCIEKIVLTDLTGKILLEQTENTNQINVQNLASGIYMLEAISGSEKWHTKFIKK
jgi:hypothetical protein